MMGSGVLPKPLRPSNGAYVTICLHQVVDALPADNLRYLNKVNGFPVTRRDPCFVRTMQRKFGKRGLELMLDRRCNIQEKS